MEQTTLTNSTIDAWEDSVLRELKYVRSSIQEQAQVCRDHLIGVDRLLKDSAQIADHERIAALTQELALMRARVEAAEQKLDQINDVVNPTRPGDED